MPYLNLLSRIRRISLLIVSLMMFTSITAIGQTASHTREPQRNFAPAGAFSLGDFESINTTNGNLILRYPLGQLPPGRNGMRGGFYLQYNSKLYDTFIGQALDISGQVSLQNLLRDTSEAGWRIRFRHELLVTNRNNEIDGGYQNSAFFSCNSESNELATYIWKVRIRFPDGSEHLFRPSGYADARGDGYFNVDTYGDVRVYGCSVPPGSQGCSCTYTQSTDPNPRMTYYSADGSYLRLTVERNQDWTLYYPDGSKVTSQGAVQRVYDRNGNYYEIVNNTITDNFGRSTTLTYDAATGDDLITQTGVGNTPLVWRIKWKTVSIVNKGYSSTAVGQQQGNTSIQQWTADYRVVDKIILPTQLGNLSYTFNYNTSTGWAEVSSVVMPADVSETPPQVAYQFTHPGPLSNGLPRCTNILRGYPSTKTLTWQAQIDGATSPVIETWLYDIGNTVTTITAPDGGVTTELHGDTSYPAPDGGLLKRVERPDGTKTERIYALNPQPWLGSLPPPLPERNAFVKTEFTTIKNAGGTYVKTAIKDFAYDKNGNVLQVTEYDWVDYSLVPKDGSGLPTGIPGGATPKRVTLNSYNNPTPDSSTPGNHSNAYWNVAPSGGYSTLTLNAIASKETRATAGGAVQARTEFSYDNPATTANVTVTRSWDSTKGAVTTPLTGGNSIVTTNQYATYSNGATGKLVKTYDANNVATGYTYGDIGNGVTDLYVTKTIVAETTSVARTSENKYDFHTGVVTEAKDTDNNVVTQTTLDVFGRPTLVKEAVGTPSERRTATEYSDTLRRVITRSDLNTAGDGKQVSIQHYDQLGRIRLSRRLENAAAESPYDETHGIKVQTRYFAGSATYPNGYTLTSNPYRAATSGAAGSETTMGWTRTKTEPGGRLIETQTFGGANQPAPLGVNNSGTGAITTSYDANAVTVTDQTGKQRRSLTDALGRLIRVDEPNGCNNCLGSVSSPSQPTEYLYDALDNLRKVTQGTQTRFFTYDSLSRLLRARNPEQAVNAALNLTDPITGNSQWAMAYSYDHNGNLLTRVDARNVTTTYAYDNLNRNTAVSYNDGVTPGVNRYYDGAISNGKGRLHYSVSYNSHPLGGYAYSIAQINGYDAMGRASSQQQGFLNSAGTQWHYYPVSRTYNLAGNVLTQTYPSTRTVSYSYAASGRLSSFSGNIGDGVTRTYADTFSYNAAGQMTKERFGTTTNLYHNLHYNNRLQLVENRLGTDANSSTTWNRGALINYYSNQARTANNQWLNATDNNGNVTRVQHFVPTADVADPVNNYAVPMIDDYDYDALNRITLVTGRQQASSGSGWTSVYAQGYSYDRWGNRTINQGATWGTGINNALYTVDTATNRLTAMNGTGMTYDSAGNQTYDATGNRWFDGENRVHKATQGSVTSHYVYDADGKRVRRIVGSTEYWQVYGIEGELIAEYPVNGTAATPQKEYGYRSGQMLIVAEGSKVQWTLADHLGTPRMVVDKSGRLFDDPATTTYDERLVRHDYLPFGEELLVGMGNSSIRSAGMGYVADAVRQKFTGYERDTESDLDFAQTRFYWNKQGRFTSPDGILIGQVEDDPQSWNLYSYVGNNPLNYNDPTGQYKCDSNGQCVGDYDGERNGMLYWYEEKQQWISKKEHEARYHVASETWETERLISTFSRGLPRIQTGEVPQMVPIVSGYRDFSNSTEGQVLMTVTPIPGIGVIKAAGVLAKATRFFKGFANRLPFGQSVRQIGRFTEFSVNVPGNVPGSYTRWVKVVNEEGKTIKLYHDTFDKTGKFIHRGHKIPGPERHIK